MKHSATALAYKKGVKSAMKHEMVEIKGNTHVPHLKNA